MIINVSRSQFFQQCRRKQWFYDQGLVQLGVAEPLIAGSAYHKGAAILTSQRDRDGALAAAETYYRDELAKVKTVLPEERVLHERQIELVKRMIDAQARQYVKDTWTVLKPEVEFLVPLPNTEHHCYFVHKLLHPDIPFKLYTADNNCCNGNLYPHYLRGKTDAVLAWNNNVWIMERKTSGMKQNIFWDQWYLSHQLSAYVYGVRKSTNLPVNGVILEKMPKPAKNQDPFSFDYSPEREPYLRSEDDLAEFEDEISRIATDYERAASDPSPFKAFYRNPQSCIDYNRRCDYWATCKRHGKADPGEFRQRDQDYVELAYYTLLGMEVPTCSSVENAVTK